MKRTVSKEVDICDLCEVKEVDYGQVCTYCGKSICRDCEDTRCVQYKHGVYASGYSDGLYCHECDKKAAETGDRLHRAYRVVLSLRNELIGISENARKRTDFAEKAVAAEFDKWEATRKAGLAFRPAGETETDS